MATAADGGPSMQFTVECTPGEKWQVGSPVKLTNATLKANILASTSRV